jgi:hypothetical protein
MVWPPQKPKAVCLCAPASIRVDPCHPWLKNLGQTPCSPVLGRISGLKRLGYTMTEKRQITDPVLKAVRDWGLKWWKERRLGWLRFRVNHHHGFHRFSG